MITLEGYNITKLKEIYPLIYKSVFKEYTNTGNFPMYVYLGKDDGTFCGFLSGYTHNQNTWYLQRAGFTTDKQGRTSTLRMTREVIAILHKDWKYIMSVVANTDFPALKMLLKVGFKIIGTRVDTGGVLWVEMIHESAQDLEEKE